MLLNVPPLYIYTYKSIYIYIDLKHKHDIIYSEKKQGALNTLTKTSDSSQLGHWRFHARGACCHTLDLACRPNVPQMLKENCAKRVSSVIIWVIAKTPSIPPNNPYSSLVCNPLYRRSLDYGSYTKPTTTRRPCSSAPRFHILQV